MRDKVTLEKAKAVAEILQKKYKFGKSTCPVWFKSTCTPMNQDGSYDVAINVPAWNLLPQEVASFFLEPFEGVHVTFRVVTTPPPINYGKKNDTKNEEKDVKKKKRSTHRKGYR